MSRTAIVCLLATLVACSSGKGGATTPAPSNTPTAGSSSATRSAPDARVEVGLGFVLLERAAIPDTTAIIAAYEKLAPDGPTLGTPQTKDDIQTFTHGGAIASVALMPMPVPNGEADDHARFSVMALVTQWKLRPHAAHLMVMTLYPGTSALERTRTAHRLIAAVALAAGTNAVGVYVGNGGVTHEAAFYAETVADTPDAIVAWSGVSIARSGNRVSLLSMGMRQLGLPDVELTAETTPAGEAMGTLFDILLYVARRGAPIPEGDTVGQSATQRIPVRYLPSPIDASVKVMRVDYP